VPRRPASPLWSSLALDRSAAASLQDQIVGYFRDAVLSGRLKGGARVPSSRVLAADHDIARITVVEAYDRLVAEGFLTSRPGSGLFVAATEVEPKVRLVAGTSRRQRKRMPELRRNDQVFLVPERPLGLLPLSPGVPALDRFPWRDWARITARLLRERPAHAMGYDDPRGDCGLRQAIAEYLGQARGIACTADQVIVVAGSQQGIDLTARVVAAPGAEAWVEDPGYPAARAALASAGLGIVPVPVGAEGLDAAKGAATAPRARLVLVSPSHQYPLGATMSLRRRLALLDWAERADAWILEDDYDGEYRYGGRPLAPLHTLDRGNRVLYLGTFSKVLAPGLRLGYLVVPEAAIAHFAQLKATTDRHAPGLDQRIVARFLAEGRLAAHLRRMRVLYAGRRAALVQALRREADDFLAVDDDAEAGLNLVARLKLRADDVAASRHALERQVHAAALSPYYVGRPRERGFVLGFAGTPEDRIAPAVRILAAAIADQRPPRSRGRVQTG
jgi:GntR family transcriptional regulator/MocR family aminotransferase